jgi:hypothetical protein
MKFGYFILSLGILAGCSSFQKNENNRSVANDKSQTQTAWLISDSQNVFKDYHCDKQGKENRDSVYGYYYDKFSNIDPSYEGRSEHQPDTIYVRPDIVIESLDLKKTDKIVSGIIELKMKSMVKVSKEQFPERCGKEFKNIEWTDLPLESIKITAKSSQGYTNQKDEFNCKPISLDTLSCEIKISDKDIVKSSSLKYEPAYLIETVVTEDAIYCYNKCWDKSIPNPHVFGWFIDIGTLKRLYPNPIDDRP